jgi:hypothetical protein
MRPTCLDDHKAIVAIRVAEYYLRKGQDELSPKHLNRADSAINRAILIAQRATNTRIEREARDIKAHILKVRASFTAQENSK